MNTLDTTNHPDKRFSKKDLLFRYSVVLALAFILILGSAMVLWYTHQETNSINQKTAVIDAEHFASSVAQFRNFYSKTIVPSARNYGMQITHNYINKDGTLPLPATFAKDFGHYLSDGQSSYSIKLYSDKPFPWRNEKLDEFEVAALKQLKKNPDSPFWSFETMNGKQVLRFAQSDVLTESCVNCHNAYPGTPKTDWKVGDLRGVLEVIRPVSSFGVELSEMLKKSLLIMSALILSMVLLIFYILKNLSNTIKTAQSSYLFSEKANKELTKEVQHRKEISHELKASGVKMRAIVDSVHDVIIVIDKSGIVSECNHAIVQMFGYTQSEVIGNNISMLMTDTHSAKHDTYIKQYVDSSVGNLIGRNGEFYALKKSGEKFPIQLFVSDARVDNEIIFTGTISDITHRKRSEELTATAHKAAIESAKLKSEFLANMSHEIRTPMNGVIGMTEMLLMSELDKEQTELAQTVKESAASLLVIINDILDFSKIEAGKLSIKKSQFNLLHMIEACIDLLAKEAFRKHVDIAFFIDHDVPSLVNNDAGRLRQILLNLLSNALKFTDKGHVILHVSLFDTTHLHFAVIDTGVGVAEEDQATLFDMFSQVDGSSSRAQGGTGLGLAICKQLTELMGGEIGASSKKDSGSTFWFTIEIEAESTPPALIDTRAQGKILMLNTSHLLNRYYAQQLQDWGLEPTIVENLNIVMEMLEEHSFDILALDADYIYINQKDVSGFKGIISQLRNKADIPIILYAKPSQLQKLENIDLGKSIYLMAKPIKHTAVKLLLSQLDYTSHKSKNIINQPDKLQISPPNKASDQYNMLLAEDNRVNQMVAVAILEKFNCKVTIAENGKQALELANKAPYDAIFMDCQMPEMDGYEASRHIRNFDSTHVNYDIPIIAFTANAMKDDDVKCKEAGMDDYLSKPIDMDALKVIFQRLEERIALRLEQEV